MFLTVVGCLDVQNAAFTKLTCMPLRLLVVVDAHEEYVTGVFGNLRGIFFALNLVDGGICGMIEF